MSQSLSPADHRALHERIEKDLRDKLFEVVDKIKSKESLTDASEIRAEFALILHDDKYWDEFRKR